MGQIVSRKIASEMINSIFNSFHFSLMAIDNSGITNSQERDIFWREAWKVDQGRFSDDFEPIVKGLDAVGFREYYKYIGKFATKYKIGCWKEYNEYEPIVIEELNDELSKHDKTEEKLDLINSFKIEELQSEAFLFSSKMKVLTDILDDFFVLDNKEQGINKVLASFSSEDKAAFISKLQNDNTILNNLINKIDGAEQREMASLIGEMFISSGFLTDQKVTLLDNKQEK